MATFFLGLGACSHSPSSSSDDYTQLSAKERFIKTSSNKLEVWREQLEDMDNENRREQLNARLNDVEQEISRLEETDQKNWSFRKERIDYAFDQMAEDFQMAE